MAGSGPPGGEVPSRWYESLFVYDNPCVGPGLSQDVVARIVVTPADQPPIAVQLKCGVRAWGLRGIVHAHGRPEPAETVDMINNVIAVIATVLTNGRRQALYNGDGVFNGHLFTWQWHAGSGAHYIAGVLVNTAGDVITAYTGMKDRFYPRPWARCRAAAER